MKQDYLHEFYEGHCDEDARLTSRCGMVEFLTTMRYIETYLKPGDRVIEIGAGTGGVVFAAYCGNDATVLQCCFGREFLKDPRYRALTDLDTFKLASTPQEVFALHRREDIDALMDGLPVKRLHFVGTDMATGYMEDTVERMDAELYELYLRYHFAVCERPDLVGASNHFLDVFQKQ